MTERHKMSKENKWALLEIHHDSDKGPNDVDFEHTITLFNTKDDAIKARTLARRRVIGLPLAETNNIEVDNGDMVVFASDDWWKWEVYEVPNATSVPGPGKKMFTVRHEWVISKDYEVEAETEEEAIHTVRDMVDSGKVCVWTDEYETTDNERLFIPEAGNGQVRAEIASR